MAIRSRKPTSPGRRFQKSHDWVVFTQATLPTGQPASEEN